MGGVGVAGRGGRAKPVSAWGENDAKEAKEAVRAEWADRVLVTRSARPREARSRATSSPARPGRRSGDPWPRRVFLGQSHVPPHAPPPLL